jgi:hypothetical protein
MMNQDFRFQGFAANKIIMDGRAEDLCYREKTGCHQSSMLFHNLPEILRPDKAAELLGVSIKTIYDWRYRQKTRNIPDDLFFKLNRLLYIRTSALQKWINQQNSVSL